MAGACGGAEQPVSQIHSVGFTLLTKFQALNFDRKKRLKQCQTSLLCITDRIVVLLSPAANPPWMEASHP